MWPWILRNSLDVRLSNLSKAERGYALLQGATPVPEKKLDVRIHSGMTAEDAYTSILWGCLAQIQANEAPILALRKPEGVHQMRVGLRRLRTCGVLFGTWVPGPAAGQGGAAGLHPAAGAREGLGCLHPGTPAPHGLRAMGRRRVGGVAGVR